MPFSLNSAAVLPILLLVLSNVFMTFAWYGHLKYTSSPLYMAVVASWGIAFFEYCLAVPANRIGHEVYSAAQLKTMQEVITLVVFAGLLGLLAEGNPDLESCDRLLPDCRWVRPSCSKVKFTS